MTLRQLSVSRRSLTIAAALVGMVSLAIGAHAALNKWSFGAAKAAEATQIAHAASKPSRLALVIGNGHYPDANAPLTQPINDARAITAALRREGFAVDVVEDASRADIDRAVDRLKDKINSESVVMLFFGGYGVQAGRESYMIPVDAAIWKESDVRREGISIESVLETIKEKGARARIAVIDASRRNPYERRFRAFSHGLAPINAPDNALILSSATPGKVADDSSGQNSVLVTELLNNIGSKAAGAEALFTKTRIAVSRASNGEQVPSVSSSLKEDVRLAAEMAAEKAGG
ncbi:MAG TPA: caspase family protein [Bradyrhizobium sp.]|nr:caspase family protein [Bradyrhizobium sp.]